MRNVRVLQRIMKIEHHFVDFALPSQSKLNTPLWSQSSRYSSLNHSPEYPALNFTCWTLTTKYIVHVRREIFNTTRGREWLRWVARPQCMALDSLFPYTIDITLSSAWSGPQAALPIQWSWKFNNHSSPPRSWYAGQVRLWIAGQHSTTPLTWCVKY